ncbi:mitochondrial import inner membrane translocase subunit Tim23 [Macrosteles quadrilineatus]|uniref:mitochondrial import inner membrane translocase subunit Tim23 n=1 Tax=Macrosteles quadrilineatus TaxID=74068 RepID=UPI0023E0B032|nr:mitochondrial import inner membrane translocase subunit Tim23 [Macrosteles quadrilineatus]
MDPPSKSGDLNSSGPSRPQFASPYLNFDPAFIPPSTPEYILLEGAKTQRGRFELAFSQIGGSCMIGAMVGGSGGFYSGLKETSLAGQIGKLRRTQILNHVMKQGAARANTLGSIAVMYSGFGVILAWLREAEDELNTVAAATTTGMLYRSTAGLRGSAIGGLAGFGLAALYCFWTSRDRLPGFTQQRNNSYPSLRDR